MPRSAARGGPLTRERIAEAAARLFLERGFDAVTVAEVAREAGVSSVTVFNHFPRKEDLYLDRQDEAAGLLRAAVRDRGAGSDALSALHALLARLADEHHPLSGLDERSGPFFRTVAGAPALVARARQIAAELQGVLAEELAGEDGRDDADLLAAVVVAGYATVLAGTARAVLDGAAAAEAAAAHRARLDRLFAALRDGFRGAAPAGAADG